MDDSGDLYSGGILALSNLLRAISSRDLSHSDFHFVVVSTEKISSANQTEQNEGTKDDPISDTEMMIQNEVVEPEEILPEQSQRVVTDNTDKMFTDSEFPDDSGDYSTIENDHPTDVNMESSSTEITMKIRI
ncbi:uncharacterized protein LOC111614091 [Centruroides sculpturatus]|uniref:uncharacterized protein LOC111614091 n=1 Tax=Centruroides sculpturatus TaxID=218467 RepID=UPI000C6D40D7|nr:uncharacterized protein LOC111614091 [Centruroides sculpturatus]